MNPRLVATSGPLKGSVFPITEAALTVGREADNQVCLDDELVSKHHFVVRIKDGLPWLKDGDTRNGTWINENAHLEKFLDHGDRIKCGSTTFLYLEHEDSDSLPTIIDEEASRNRQLETLRADYSVRGEAAVYYRAVIQGFARMTASINAIPEINELQVRLLDLAFEIIPARRAAILLNGQHVSPDPGDFVSQIYRERDFDGQARFPVSGGVLGNVYAARVPCMTNNITPVLCVPLIVSGVMRGVLYMEGTDLRSGFEPEHLHYLNVVADNTVAALRLARHVESIRNERDVLKAELDTDYKMVGESEAMKAVHESMRMAADSAAPVLIVGETGTGKELVARGIHDMSSRAESLFVAVNCPAVVESLFESEFLGHVKGAFTGAMEARQGKFQLAHGGTLLLDEIGELKLPMQPKLLRVLQEQEFEPVGGNLKVKVDVRVIAATNVDLAKAIEEGKFRQDLFHRLNTITIQLPPLRERREDIPLLAGHFIRKYGIERQVTAIAPEALEAIISYNWPGNVRELENVVRCGVELARSARTELIRLQDLPRGLTKPKTFEQAARASLSSKVDEVARQTRNEAAWQMMKETGGNVPEAARRLGISKGYLYRLLRGDE